MGNRYYVFVNITAKEQFVKLYSEPKVSGI